jgi:hypothetical protein
MRVVSKNRVSGSLEVVTPVSSVFRGTVNPSHFCRIMPETQEPILRSHSKALKVHCEIVAEICEDQRSFGPNGISMIDWREKTNYTTMFIDNSTLLSVVIFIIWHGEYVEPTRFQDSLDFAECRDEVLDMFENILGHDEIKGLCAKSEMS